LVTAAVAKWGESALTKAEDTVTTETVKLGQRLLSKLFSRAKVREPVKAALADLATAIDDPDFQAACGRRSRRSSATTTNSLPRWLRCWPPTADP